jgi:tRNA U55 pseudouridine synthase TruB
MNKIPALHGVFAVNKPIGWTSRDVVNRVQNVLTKSWCLEHNLPLTKKKLKMGHGGTLVMYPTTNL